MDWSFNEISDSFFGVLDRVSEGVGAYFDGRIALTEAEAAAKNYQSMLDDAETMKNLEYGSGASTWGSPDYQGFNFRDPQNILIIAALGVTAFAVLRA